MRRRAVHRNRSKPRSKGQRRKANSTEYASAAQAAANDRPPIQPTVVDVASRNRITMLTGREQLAEDHVVAVNRTIDHPGTAVGIAAADQEARREENRTGRRSTRDPRRGPEGDREIGAELNRERILRSDREIGQETDREINRKTDQEVDHQTGHATGLKAAGSLWKERIVTN